MVSLQILFLVIETWSMQKYEKNIWTLEGPCINKIKINDEHMKAHA